MRWRAGWRRPRQYFGTFHFFHFFMKFFFLCFLAAAVQCLADMQPGSGTHASRLRRAAAARGCVAGTSRGFAAPAAASAIYRQSLAH
jgi:hypothetical protein